MRRMVTFLGLAVVASGLWTLRRTYKVVGNCRVLNSTVATSGVDRVCSRTVFGYVEGVVLIVSGLLVVAIAMTMISRRSRMDLRCELRAVPRNMAKPKFVIVSPPSEFQGQLGSPPVRRQEMIQAAQ